MALPEVAFDVPVRVEWKLMASLRSDSPTVTNVELAKRIGVNVNTITRWLGDPGYQRYENWILTKNFEAMPLERKVVEADVQATLQGNAPEMADRLYKIIESTGDPKLEAELCQDWLDRAGFAAQRKVATSQLRPVILTAEAAEIFFRRAKEAGLVQVASTPSETSPPIDGAVMED